MIFGGLGNICVENFSAEPCRFADVAGMVLVPALLILM